MNGRHETAVDDGVHDGDGGDLLAHKGGHEVSDLAAFGDSADADAFRGVNVVARQQVVDGLFKIVQIQRLSLQQQETVIEVKFL